MVLASSALNPANVTPLDEISGFTRGPAVEYYQHAYSFTTSNIVALLLLWILVLLPLVQGPKSLVRSFYFGFPFILILEIVLLARAVTLPGATERGIALLLGKEEPSEIHYAPFQNVVTIALGYGFGVHYGLSFFLGKYAEKKSFLFLPIVIAMVTAVVLYAIGAIKLAAFAGFYDHVSDKEASYIFWLADDLMTVPALLSLLPLSRVWLIIYLLSRLSCAIPGLSLGVEILASSLAECLPKPLADRTKLPQNLILSVILVILGFLGSLGLLFVGSSDFHTDNDSPWQGLIWSLNGLHTLVYLFALYLISSTVLPLAISKVASAGHDNLCDFIERQGAIKLASARKGVTIFCIVMMAIVIFVLPVGIAEIHDQLWVFANFHLITEHYSKIVILVVPAVIMIVVAIIQAVLICFERSRHPCCPPLGRITVPEKVEMDQL